MEVLDIHTTYANYDPTHTTLLRNAFAKKMNSKFIELCLVVRVGIDKRDCFGLKKGVHTLQMTPPSFQQFAFLRDPEKVEAFMNWLQEQVDKGILTVAQFQQIGSAVEATWTNLYIYDSYKRGVLRARQEMINAGMKIPSVEDSGGIDAIMNTPFHMDRVGLLFTRVFNELKNITSAMDLQISKILAQGLVDGDGPALLARKIVATINGNGVDKLGITDTLGRFIPAKRRAEMMARTEMIRSFNKAQLQEFRNWGVLGISVKAEWKTAEDSRVCEKCSPMEGKVFTLDEAENLLPAHPLCRCCFLPHIEALKKYE